MGTFLSSAGLLLAAAQAVASPPPSVARHDSVRAALWARVMADSTEGRTWLALGRAYLDLAAEYHRHRGPADSAQAHASLDSADYTLSRAARLLAGSRAGDTARVYQVFVVGERAYLDWERAGPGAATAAWHRLPETVRLPPVLEELGENLLRACPRQGVLFTANDVDTHGAWYLRFARGLRPDLLIVPLARWRGDSVFRRFTVRALNVADGAIRTLAQGRAVCASMAFERPPEARPSVKWNRRPLVWVTGRETRADRVPANDFVFAALSLSVGREEAWTAAALAVYRRAVDQESDLCRPLRTFGLRREVGC